MMGKEDNPFLFGFGNFSGANNSGGWLTVNLFVAHPGNTTFVKILYSNTWLVIQLEWHQARSPQGEWEFLGPIHSIHQFDDVLPFCWLFVTWINPMFVGIVHFQNITSFHKISYHDVRMTYPPGNKSTPHQTGKPENHFSSKVPTKR